jgi:hypothetical protein
VGVCAKGIKKELNTLDEADFVRDVDKSAYHHLSQGEIDGDNPCSQHLSSTSLFWPADHPDTRFIAPDNPFPILVLLLLQLLNLIQERIETLQLLLRTDTVPLGLAIEALPNQSLGRNQGTFKGAETEPICPLRSSLTRNLNA